MLLPKTVWLTPTTLEFYASRQGLSLPATLRPEPIWRDEEELSALGATSHAELREQGLLDRDAPSVELVIALRALCAGEQECFAYVSTAQTSTRLHAAVSGSDLVFAQFTEGTDRIELRDASAKTVTEQLARELPECPRANEQTITCPVRELTGKKTEVAVERILSRDAKRMKALHDPGQRLLEAKLMVAARDGSGRRHTSGTGSPVVLDVEPGKRWITYLTGPDEDPYLNARAADRLVIVEQLDRTMARLVEAHQ